MLLVYLSLVYPAQMCPEFERRSFRKNVGEMTIGWLTSHLFKNGGLTSFVVTSLFFDDAFCKKEK